MQINEQLFIQESFVLIIIFPLAGTEKWGCGENGMRLVYYFASRLLTNSWIKNWKQQKNATNNLSAVIEQV
jgi:hypothetical protein